MLFFLEYEYILILCDRQDLIYRILLICNKIAKVPILHNEVLIEGGDPFHDPDMGTSPWTVQAV